MKRDKGFTLIELMIVVAIIVIIAAIVAAHLQRARLASNESATITTMRTLPSAEREFQSATVLDADADGNGEFGTLAQLAGYNPPFIDEVLGQGQKSGYYFSLTVGSDKETQWWAAAWPVEYNVTGKRVFYIDETGILRGKDRNNNNPIVSREAGQVMPVISLE